MSAFTVNGTKGEQPRSRNSRGTSLSSAHLGGTRHNAARRSRAGRRSAHRREQRRQNGGRNREAVRHASGDHRSDRGGTEELVPVYGHALPMRITRSVAVLQKPRRPGCGQNVQVVEFTRIYVCIIQVRNSAYKERARLVDETSAEYGSVRPSTRFARMRLFPFQSHDDLAGCAWPSPRPPVFRGVT